MIIWIISISLATKDNAAIKIHVQVFEWMYVFISLGYTPKSRTAGLYGNSMLNFLKNYQTVSKIATDQPYMIPISPNPYQHLLTSF